MTDLEVQGDARGRGEPEATPGPSSPGGPGLFVVLEGVEGAGKTTQLRLLARHLEARGVEVVPGREPGGTPVGEAVRGVLLDRGELDLAPESELLLMLAARAAFVRDRVRPALARGAVMLADRFETSTFAYQGYGRGLPLDEVRRLNRFATGGLRPDRVLILDLPVEEGRARQRREGKGADRIEAGGDAFHHRVAQGYRELAAASAEAELVSALGSEDEVHQRIVGVLDPLLCARFPELPPFQGGLRRGALDAS